jgi:hypothetical protein
MSRKSLIQSYVDHLIEQGAPEKVGATGMVALIYIAIKGQRDQVQISNQELISVTGISSNSGFWAMRKRLADTGFVTIESSKGRVAPKYQIVF